jgi:flagellar M-ring protein FliF
MPTTDPATPSSGPAASLEQVKERVTKLIGGFSRGQRTTLAVAAVAVVALVLAVSYVRGHGPMAPLYSNLSSEDVGVITKKLQEQGVGYQLTGNGGTVEVPEAQVYQLRADLADLELPGAGKVGWGILDGQGIAASDFSQQVGFQRAMEGEMAKTIEAMSGIEAATVHLALPKDQVFALDDEKPSASVLVQTSDTLDDEQVRAITNIVASGIQGLSADRVSVADSKGHVLAAPGDDATSGARSGDQQESLDSYESSVSNAIESMLAASFGPGKAKVTVSADLDFDQRSTTNETFAAPTTVPGATAPLAKDESTKTETYGAGAGGAPAGSLGGGATGDGGYNLDQKDVHYALDHAVETTNHAPGTVQRLSVAVIVDEKAISASEVPNIQELVSAAAGVKTERGDTVVVNRMPFDASLTNQMKKELAARSKAKSASSSMPLFAAAAAIALLVAGSTLMVMRRRKKDLRQLEQLAAQLSNRNQPVDVDIDVTGVQPVITPGNDGASVDGRFGSSAPSLIGVENRREERQQVLTELIDNQPDEVAQLLRGWLGDRRAVKR